MESKKRPSTSLSRAGIFLCLTTAAAVSLLLLEVALPVTSLVANFKHEDQMREVGAACVEKTEFSARDDSFRERVFIPNGTWVRSSNGNHTYMERAANGTLVRLWPEEGGEDLHMLHGKWVYFWGDSTLRQVWAILKEVVTGNVIGFEEEKEIFRTYPTQRGRKSYVQLPNDQFTCGLNEHTADLRLTFRDSPPPAPTMDVTFNWKHFIDEEYDEFFFQEELSLLLKERGKLPDVIVMSTGLHNCIHFGASLAWENRRDFDSLLRRVREASKNYTMPPIVWIDNVRIEVYSGNPEACLAFNEHFRLRVMEEMQMNGLRGALVSRERLVMDAPSEFWGDPSRVHLSAVVQRYILTYVLRAMGAVGLHA